MANDQTMRLRSQNHNNNVVKRGNVPESRKAKKASWPAGTCMMAMFFFLIVGSALFQMVNSAKGKYAPS